MNPQIRITHRQAALTRKNPDQTDSQAHETEAAEQEQQAAPLRNVSDFLGIILLASGLFNLPAILKKPQNDSDWMMLVIVIALAAAGGILLGAPRLLQSISSKRNNNS